MQTFLKNPAESYPVTIDFKDKLPVGYTLSSGAVSAVDTSDGSDQTQVVLTSATANVAGSQVSFTVRAGTSGRSYQITALVNLSGGAGPLQQDVLMVVD